ncbi:hypothetical protein ISCGN_001141 [Ixodes scapularis]
MFRHEEECSGKRATVAATDAVIGSVNQGPGLGFRAGPGLGFRAGPGLGFRAGPSPCSALLRSIFSSSAVDATSYPSRSSAGRKSRDLPVGHSDTESSKSHDSLNAGLGATSKSEASTNLRKKIEIVAATVSHWGKSKRVDVGAVLQNLTSVLTEKIQDNMQAESRLMSSNAN